MLHYARAVLFPGQTVQIDDLDGGLERDASNVVLGVTYTFFALAMISVAIRIYTRAILTRFLGWDDWWTVIACVFSAGDQTLKAIWCEHGLGKHVQSVSADDIAISLKVAYAIQALYPWGLGAVKISVLIFYLRCFPYPQFRMLCYGMICFVVAMTLAISIGQLTACSPISMGWSATTAGSCANKAALQYTGSVFNLVTDLFILFMPLKYLWALTKDKNMRKGIIPLFTLGLMTCVTSAVRLSTIHAFYSGSDPTYDAYPISICSGIEVNLTIITASIPGVKPFVMKYIWTPCVRLFSSDSGSDEAPDPPSTRYEKFLDTQTNTTQSTPDGSPLSKTISAFSPDIIFVADANGRIRPQRVMPEITKVKTPRRSSFYENWSDDDAMPVVVAQTQTEPRPSLSVEGEEEKSRRGSTMV